MDMGKKNPNRFTIGFNKDKPTHQKAVEILNQTDDKAELIAAAILRYVGESDSEIGSETDLEHLQPLIQGWIKQEVKKAVRGIGGFQKQEEPEVTDLTLEDEILVDENLAESLFSAMDTFRKT